HAGVRVLGPQAQRHQHVRGARGGGTARRAGRDRDAELVQLVKHRLAVHAGEAEVHDRGEPPLGIAVQPRAGDRAREPAGHPPASRTLTGIFPTACTASQWNRAPAACASSARRAIGWMVPISLLTHITETSATSGPSASSRRVGSSTPFGSTGTMVIAKPRDSR